MTTRIVSQPRFTAENLEELVDQLNRTFERLWHGGIVLNGVRIAVRAALPPDAPDPGQPNVVLYNDSGTVKLALFDGTNWVVAGTQT